MMPFSSLWSLKDLPEKEKEKKKDPITRKHFQNKQLFK